MGLGEPGRLELAESSSAVSDLSAPSLDLFHSQTLLCHLRILRYDPKASLISVSVSSSVPEVSKVVIPWMAATLQRAVQDPFRYVSMISRHFSATCNAYSVAGSPTGIGAVTSTSGIGK